MAFSPLLFTKIKIKNHIVKPCGFVVARLRSANKKFEQFLRKINFLKKPLIKYNPCTIVETRYKLHVLGYWLYTELLVDYKS